MDIEAQRKAYLDSIEAAVAARPPPVPGKAVNDYAATTNPDPAKLMGMINGIYLQADTFAESARALLDIVANESLPTDPRMLALSRLGEAEFHPVRFAPFAAEYNELLRKLAVCPDKDLRHAALERLTLTNDSYAQKLLRQGLEKKRKPLMPPAKAIQLLARDDHAAARPLFRELAANGKGRVREQALRALAADSKSAALFEQIATDKKEATPLRQIATVNLRNTSANRFAKVARKLVLDDDEDDNLRAAAVSAIAHHEHVARKVATPRFAKQVEQVGSGARSRALKSSVRHFSRTVKRFK
jgi:hypothetical protein